MGGNFLVKIRLRQRSIHHDVSHYAGRLCITPDYLNKITHRYYGISAKEMIDQFLISGIKNSLSPLDYRRCPND